MTSLFKVGTGKVFVVIFLGLISLTSYFIIFNYFDTINRSKSESLDRMYAVANTLAVSINGDNLENLLTIYTSPDAISTSGQSKTYDEIHELLNKCHHVNAFSSDIYTIHKDDYSGEFKIGVTSNESPYYRHKYNNPPEQLHDYYYFGGKLEEYTSDTGEWLSVVSPIKNSRKEIIGAIQMDLPFKEFLASSRENLIKHSFISLIIYLAIGIAMFQMISKVLKIEQRRKAIELERKSISDFKQQEISSSISYARRIQQALWPDNDKLKKEFSDFFSINLPKDTVSGDFYWHHKINGTDEFLIIHADCTGHGVPGAMMSVLGNTIFNEIVVNYGITEPDQILNLANKKLIRLLQQEKEENLDDGMAVSIALVNKKKMTLKYAGANQNSIIVRNGQLIDLECDKYPVGGAHYNPQRNYSTKTVLLEQDDALYLFSDGFKDQFGGPQNKKFLGSNFYKLLIEHSRKSMDIQKQIILDVFKKWRGDFEQIDDVSLVGLKI